MHGRMRTDDTARTWQKDMAMGKSAGKNGNRIIRFLMTALTVVLIVLFLNIMSLVADIQGTARVVNYAGLVRGTTQRIVKLEDAHVAQDKLLEAVDSYIDGLRFGSDKLDLVRLDDDEYQAKMTELASYFATLRGEIERVREVGYENTDIIAESEEFFGICDEATHLAEEYSQRKATALNDLENVVFADIVALLALFAIEIVRALRTASLNRALQKKVYFDEACGIPNKNKCEEVLDREGPIPAAHPVALCVFDLNNLRTVNNDLGHEKGDEYICAFARQLAKVAGDSCFVGRYGGDEFISVLEGADEQAVKAHLAQVRENVEAYSRENPDMPLSYAAGFALSSDFKSPTMRGLFRQADRNMYVDKNRAKTEAAAEKRRRNRLILDRLENEGHRFSACLYCNAKLDSYRVLRTSSEMFLAEGGNYSGAVEQIVEVLSSPDDGEKMRDALQIDSLSRAFRAGKPRVEILYRNDAYNGRLTVLPFGNDSEGELHHFVVGFESFSTESRDEKQQLSRYYDQMRQSLIENSSYVDALLDSAQASYSVDLTDNLLEKVFSHPSMNRIDLGIEPPCAYDDYCRIRSEFVTDETLESYRLIDTSEKLLERFNAGLAEVTIEYCERTRDGGSIWLQKIVLMSRDTVYDEVEKAERSIVRGIILFRETSAFHEREQREVARLEKELETADSESRAKTEFMNRMSHDFRTPINGILGMLEIIRMSGQDPEKTRECLDKIQVSANHLIDLVNDVLDMNKLSSGQVVLQQERFNLEKLMGEVTSLVDAQMAESGIAHSSHYSNIRHSNLVGSGLRLRQVMLNLFSNAIKYNKPNGTVDTYATELSCDGETARFEFKIADTGIGMSREFVEHELFEPFTQEHHGARTQYRGTGLGMSIVKTLIDAMGGEIDVQSERGVGTTITFRLAFKVDAAGEAAEGARDDGEVASLAGKRVLLVEDNELNMEIAEFYLTSAGATVLKAWNGKEAVQEFNASEPDSISLILMDLMMPVMDGLDATRAIRALNRPDARTVPIVAMTANAFDEDRERTRAAGMDAHLSKPLDMRALVSAVKKLCR